MSKLSRAVKLILAVWVISFSFAVPQALQFGLVYTGTVSCLVKQVIIQHSFELSTFLFFVAPMILITVLYALIGLRLRTSNMMKRNSGHSVRNCTGNSRRSCRHQHGQSSRRVLKMLVAVVVAFFICWAPFHAQRLVAIYANPPYKLKLYEVITYISGVLYYVSTTVNPVLYHIMSNKFREAFKETFSRCWCWECGERSRRSGSGRLSDRRSCYSVLSRSGGGGRSRQGQQDSTDSGTSVTHRHSEDSMCMHPQPISVTPCAQRHGILTHNDGPEATESKAKFVSEQFSFDMQQVASLNKQNNQCDNQRRSRAARFLGLFRCIAKRSFDEKKLQPYNTPSPISEHYEREKATNEMNERFHLGSYDVSNSSLKDIESGALEDELTIYMKEIQRREKDKS